MKHYTPGPGPSLQPRPRHHQCHPTRLLALLGLLAALPVGLGLSGPAQAHEVRLEQQQGSAAVLQLRYADGQPFAFERYELYRPAAQTPTQVGQTDAQGRIVFLPEAQTEWQLKAYSADGHGLSTTLTLAVAPGQHAAEPRVPPEPAYNGERLLRLLGGAALLLASFAILAIYQRRPRKSQ